MAECCITGSASKPRVELNQFEQTKDYSGLIHICIVRYFVWETVIQLEDYTKAFISEYSILHSGNEICDSDPLFYQEVCILDLSILNWSISKFLMLLSTYISTLL